MHMAFTRPKRTVHTTEQSVCQRTQEDVLAITDNELATLGFLQSIEGGELPDGCDIDGLADRDWVIRLGDRWCLTVEGRQAVRALLAHRETVDGR